MSQRQVNLRSSNQLASTAANIVQTSASTSKSILNSVAKRQELNRRQTEQALLLGNKTSEELIQAYSDKIKSSDVEFNTQLNGYVRQEAERIGALKANAEKPGATKEDREAYLEAKQTGTDNLTNLAIVSATLEQNRGYYNGAAGAIAEGSSLGKLERGYAQNTNTIKFNSSLLTNTYSDVNFATNEGGQLTISLVPDGETDPVTFDVTAEANAFKQTGESIATAAISEDDLLTGKTGLGWVTEASKFKDLLPTRTNVTTDKEKEISIGTIDIDGETADIMQQTRLKIENVSDTLLKNHSPWLDSKIGADFAKQWDQLYDLKEIDNSNPLSQLSWGTLNNANKQAGVDNLIKMYKKDNLNIEDLDRDDKPGFTVEDYELLQKEQRELAKKGLANFLAKQLEVDYVQQQNAEILTLDKD
tara:strand:+ start:4026 stop:5279 length:1254 start_codon:yes stop_codon:yes gene_type:complete